MLPAFNLKWSCFDEVLDGQYVGVHQQWIPKNPNDFMIIMMYSRVPPNPPLDIIIGNWVNTPISIGEPMLQWPARFLVGEAKRVIFDGRPFWFVVDKMIPVLSGSVPYLVIVVDDCQWCGESDCICPAPYEGDR